MRLRVFTSPGIALISFAILTFGISTSAQQSVAIEPAKQSISILDSTREQDGLFGPVRRIHTEMSRLSSSAGSMVEEPRMLLEVTTYDPQGKRIWNVYFPVNTGTFEGNQEFIYDAQGHVREMTLRDDAGHVISRESYTYDFDKFGNWTRMTSSLVVFDGNKLTYEPFETTYRAISYYYDDSVAQIVNSSSTPAEQSKSVPPINATASSASGTTSSDSQESAKQQSLNKQGGNVAGSPAGPQPNNVVPPDKSKIETARDDETLSKRSVEVTASTSQAFQIPASSVSAPVTTKPTVSGGVINGKILSLPKPIYPKDALIRGVYGVVVIEVTVDEEGHVIGTRALSGHPLLRNNAEHAARLARFDPTLLSGQPVKATRLVSYNFNKP